MKKEVICCNNCKKLNDSMHIKEPGWIIITGNSIGISVTAGDKYGYYYREIPAVTNLHFCSASCLLEYIFKKEKNHSNQSMFHAHTQTEQEALTKISEEDPVSLPQLTKQLKAIES